MLTEQVVIALAGELLAQGIEAYTNSRLSTEERAAVTAKGEADMRLKLAGLSARAQAPAPGYAPEPASKPA